jgi:hypothetical protein
MGDVRDGLLSAAKGLNITIPDDELQEYETLISRMDAALKTVAAMDGANMPSPYISNSHDSG